MLNGGKLTFSTVFLQRPDKISDHDFAFPVGDLWLWPETRYTSGCLSRELVAWLAHFEGVKGVQC